MQQNFGLGTQAEQPAPGPSPIFIAHSDNTIKVWDPNNSQAQPQAVGQHELPVKDVYSFAMNGQSYLVSGGWDAMVKFW